MPATSYEGVELRGLSLRWIVSGFRVLPHIGMRYLAEYGLTRKGADGKPTFEVEAWYPLDKGLAVVEAIARDVGGNVMREIGRNAGANAPMPPNISDIDATMRALDTSYHMFHRKNGKDMYDEATRRMTEGIGHYGYARTPGQRRIVLECDNPYPCDMDLGIVMGFACRFEARAKVEHLAAPCRKNGGQACTYVVTW